MCITHNSFTMWGYGYGPMMGYDVGYGIFHLIWSVFWIIVLIIGAVWLIRALRGGKRPNMMQYWRENNSAMETLRERYAKGEIDTAEYEERKKTLSS